jgi:hypothetical protein
MIHSYGRGPVTTLLEVTSVYNPVKSSNLSAVTTYCCVMRSWVPIEEDRKYFLMLGAGTRRRGRTFGGWGWEPGLEEAR